MSANGAGSGKVTGRSRRWVVVMNVRAARAKSCLGPVVSALHAARIPTEVKTAGDADEAWRLASEVAGEEVAVGVVGGDGTAGHVAGAVAGGKAWLAPLPGGTFNGICRQAGVPLNPGEAVARLLDARPVSWDLGFAGERPFLQSAGIGFDGKLVAGIEGAKSSRTKIAAYILGMIRLFGAAPPRFTVEWDGKKMEDVHEAVFSNTSKWTFFMHMNPQADPGDGRLDLALFPWRGRAAWTGQILSLTGAGAARMAGYAPQRTRIREARIVSPVPVPAQADGEPFEVKDIRVSIREKAVWVLSAA